MEENKTNELETEKDAKTLKVEYKAARQFGKVALGSENFFYKDKFKVRYIPFANVYRAFRRVQCVNMKMCCAESWSNVSGGEFG